jgi:hypothetical protein
MKALQRAGHVFLAALAVAAVASLAPSANPVRALTNCIEIGPDAPLRGCWENVWVDGVEYRMTFFGGQKPFKGNVPTENLGAFYVIGPQTDMPQSLDHPFMHDHVVAAVPSHNGGGYTPIYQGTLVLCSGEGLTTGACVATFSTPPGGSGPIPLATTVNGESLTSTEAVEAAAAAGLVVLIPAGVLIGAISGN